MNADEYGFSMLLYTLIDLLITATIYMAFPIAKLLINDDQFPRKRANKIALWNSIVIGAVFLGLALFNTVVSGVVSEWNWKPPLFYYFINRAILTDKSAEESTESKSPAVETTANVAHPSKPAEPVKRVKPKRPKSHTTRYKSAFPIILCAVLCVLSVFISVSEYSSLKRAADAQTVEITTHICYITATGECYHAPICPYADTTNDEFLTTVYEARLNGYRECTLCGSVVNTGRVKERTLTIHDDNAHYPSKGRFIAMPLTTVIASLLCLFVYLSNEQKNKRQHNYSHNMPPADFYISEAHGN